MTKVSIIKCETYEQNKVDKAIKGAVKAIGGIKQFIKKGDKVLIKPNMVIAKKPDASATTHPHVVKAVIKLAQDAGAKVTVGDSSWKGDILRDVGPKTGIERVCKEMKVRLISLCNSCELKVKGKVVKSFFISKEIFQFNKIINLPKMKTHVLADYTGAVKNLYGCLPGNIKSLFHNKYPDKWEFSEMLLDLHELVKPKLNIMDGIIGMEGAGPTNGKPRKAKVILASDSAISLDVIATKIMGLKKVPVIENAKNRNLKEVNIKNIQVIGKILKVKFQPATKSSQIKFLPYSIQKFIASKFGKWPIVNKRKCIGCGSCYRVCPGRAITMKNNKPDFDYEKCIRCYCCHEVCPVGAIKFEKDIIRSIQHVFINKKIK